MWYEILVFVLFLLAIIDLMVGVSNDAANFLNSAVGSKVASFRTILIIASIGVLAGAISSAGMMEVARKGIFIPGYFTFDAIMLVYVAVMITDIILLDFYNSIGLPTSTTVSIVFELLGAAFIIGLLTTWDRGDKVALENFLNFSTATKIIFGIFLSVLVAFSTGAVVQFITRFLFTFDLEKGLKRYGSVFTGIAVTAITYFLLIKGLKGSSFITDDVKHWINENTLQLISYSVVGWSLISYLAIKAFKINPLRIIVLMGTFSLAMAFAGNDLVNFIGVSVAGWQSLQAWSAEHLSTGVAADSYFMHVLSAKTKAPLYMLLAAGIVMVITLWTSKKARNVSQTEVKLARQGDGEERFKSNRLSRIIVGFFISIGNGAGAVLGKKNVERINARFALQRVTVSADAPSFDLLRASVNLMTAAILIAYATSLKLPLSTTYVSFMVAMGTSLADRAWGIESAVYRVSGVLQVIGGWVMTAVIAFTASAVFGAILFYGGKTGMFVALGLAAVSLVRSHVVFKKLRTELDEEDEVEKIRPAITELFEKHKEEVNDDLRNLDKLITLSLRSLVGSNKDILAEAVRRLKADEKKIDKAFKKALVLREGFTLEESVNYARLKVESNAKIGDMYRMTRELADKCLEHVNNFGSVPRSEYIDFILQSEEEVKRFLNDVRRQIRSDREEHSGLIGDKTAYLKSHLNHRLNGELDYMLKEEVSVRLGKLQVHIILDLLLIVDMGEDIYRIHHDFFRDYIKK